MIIVRRAVPLFQKLQNLALHLVRGQIVRDLPGGVGHFVALPGATAKFDEFRRVVRVLERESKHVIVVHEAARERPLWALHAFCSLCRVSVATWRASRKKPTVTSTRATISAR